MPVIPRAGSALRMRRLPRSVGRIAASAAAIALAAGGLAATTTAASAATAAATPAHGGSWQSSFEADQFRPTGVVPATAADGTPDVSGVVGAANDASGLDVEVGAGPAASYTAKTGVGFTGASALRYAARHTAGGEAHASAVLVSTRLTVGRDSELSYVVHPDFDEKRPTDYASTYIAIDLEFTDGSRLSGLRLPDQNGIPLVAHDQGASSTGFPMQWNDRRIALGDAAGKTVRRILLDYDGPAGPTAVGGWIDDLRIGRAATEPSRNSPVDWVDTRRGTQSNGDYSRGNNFPAVTMPNGFNFWTPVTDASSLGTLYSWSQQNTAENLPAIQAFSASHETSIWMGDRQTFQVMPSISTGVPSADRAARAMTFRHENETATPYRYAVRFENGLSAELTPTDHAAMMRFVFPKGAGRSLVFDNVNDSAGLTIDRAAGTVSGWTETKTIGTGTTRMFVYGEFDSPIRESGMLADGNRPSTGYARFADRTVTMRVATSLLGLEQAKHNLALEIPAGDSFDTVQARAKKMWNERLGVIEVQGATHDQRATLYGSLYRVNMYPNSGYENTGTAAKPVFKHAVQSSGSWSVPPSTPTETGAKVADGKVFVNTGFWDTFRTAWPLYSLLYPDVAGELVDGFVQQYRDGGWISPWSSPGYARVMTGTNSDAAFATAFANGITGFDAGEAYDAALKNATVRPTDSSVGRDSLERSTFLGYVPNDVGSGFSWSMDGYANDGAIATMAKGLAAQKGTSAADRKRLLEEAQYFADRSVGYGTLFDPSIGFFQGRSASGAVTTPTKDYDPTVWGNNHDYTEADGWTESFPALADGEGLASLYGGRAELAKHLDSYFSTPETALKPGSYGWTIHEMRETRDLRLGQWSIPNQVSYHIPWMYAYTQQPWKGQAEVRKALQRGWLGSAIGQGYPGDEDNGATSSVWTFMALGLYPLQPGSGQYVVGSPLFEKTVLHLPRGDVSIDAPGTSRGKQYVQALTVDGRAQSSTVVDHAILAEGATLNFRMGASPSAWGTGAEDVPASTTAAGSTPAPLRDVTGAARGIPSSSGDQDVSALFDDDSRTETTLTGDHPSVGFRPDGDGTAATSFYTVTSAATEGADPRSWVLEGSDDGKRWRVLDRRVGESFDWRGQTRPFQLAKPSTARYLRLTVAGTSGDAASGVRIAELEFLTTDPAVTSPVTVAVQPSTAKAGGTATADVVVTNRGSETLTPTLAITPPGGWTATPSSVTVHGLAPGTSATATIELAAPADAAPGIRRLVATARWGSWSVSGAGAVQVTGDVVEIEPGSDAEAAVLTADDGSKLGDDGPDGHVRYADGTASFVYRLPVSADAVGTLTLDIANQFSVQASSDGATWTTVLAEPSAATFRSNRGERRLDLATLRQRVGAGALFLRIGDSSPSDGWGGWLAGMRIETAG